jgi:glycosyltransferase involved in cell wall biosynthesis
MDLTVITPCHNLETFIAPLLSSLKSQDLGGYEVELIFICNDCTDNTEKIIFNADLSQYKVQMVVTNYKTVGPARNAGLDRAHGDYIWFVDGDDWLLEKDAIKTLIETMKAQNADIIKFDYEAPKFKDYGHKSMVWQYCMRRDFIGDNRFSDIWYNEDVKFMGPLLCDLTHPVYYLRKKLYYYNYLREGSLMYERVVQKKQKEAAF